ncbi:glycine betaine ABC transporter substrate-binding protein [Nocardia mexicana]|uniref:Osmoprotectant transport system substrate-binding protein n=1 Tax=Nocardia mexicana TaxID=279262 RepID=A0A370H8S6_9NOCA|nr:glycine betaine ABC transporter substrate-binding protein [Nocardia mexicana]RDI53061.1 osmoprotectant transport system substrate-binding protein [Nocardia mexicana]
MELAASVRNSVRAVVAIMAATLVVSCSDGDSGTTITVGAGNSAQSELIAEIYAGALARAGAHTTTRTGLGQRGDYLTALDAGTVQLVGDDSGDLLTALDSGSQARLPDKLAAAKVTGTAAPKANGNDAQGTGGKPPGSSGGNDAPGGDSAGVKAPDARGVERVPDVADAVSRALPEGLAVSDIADGTDLRPAFVFSGAASGRYPDSLKELAPRCGELTVGVATGSELDPLRRSPDPQRDVLEPLHTVYGCDITHHTVYPNDSALRKALQEGQIQAGVLTAPAALLPGGAGDLVPIADPDYAFRAQSVIPLYRKGTLTARQLKKLNYVAGELTTADLTDMVRALRDDHASAPDLARTWLDSHDL